MFKGIVNKWQLHNKRQRSGSGSGPTSAAEYLDIVANGPSPKQEGDAAVTADGAVSMRKRSLPALPSLTQRLPPPPPWQGDDNEDEATDGLAPCCAFSEPPVIVMKPTKAKRALPLGVATSNIAGRSRSELARSKPTVVLQKRSASMPALRPPELPPPRIPPRKEGTGSTLGSHPPLPQPAPRVSAEHGSLSQPIDSAISECLITIEKLKQLQTRMRAEDVSSVTLVPDASSVT
jgi:hypothetical protein